MRRLLSVLALAAAVSAGCATGAAAIPGSLDPSRATLAAPAPAAPGVGGRWISHVSLLGGGRWLEKSDWEPLEHQLLGGLELDESFAATGNGYEAGFLYAEDEDDLESTSYELYGGYRYTFRAAEEGLHPFVSLGLSAQKCELEASVAGVNDTDDDTVVGAYARAGLLWDLSERVRLGLDYRRFISGDLDFELLGSDVQANSDYDQVVLSLGFEF